MPKNKMKTKSVCKRRFKLTASGKIKRFKAGHNHFMRNKSKRANTSATKSTTASAENARSVRKWMPYI